MKHIVTICRIALGLIFVVFGLNGFLHFLPTPQYPGIAGQFLGAIFNSHFYIIIFLTQVVGGLLLLANLYVPLAVLLLGPVLVNILNFHISMYPATIALALIATALWLVLFFQLRSAFSGVFVRRVPDAGGSVEYPTRSDNRRAREERSREESKDTSGNWAA